MVSTNALELGIDIGSLDAVIMAGYPGTMMATWQQAGRAGRNGSLSAAFLIAGGNPLDQYFMRHPDLFFGAPLESAIIDLANPYILSGQILCAAAELPITGENIAGFGPDAGPAIEALIKERLISPTCRGFVYSGSRRPHELVRMGSISRDSFRVIADGRTLETLDRNQAFREAHTGAVLLHQGEQYLVDSMDILHGIIRVSRTDVDYYTRPLKSVDIKVREVLETTKLQDIPVSFGEVEVTEQYYAYKIIRKDTLLGVEPLDLPPSVSRQEPSGSHPRREQKRGSNQKGMILTGGCMVPSMRSLPRCPCTSSVIGGTSGGCRCRCMQRQEGR